MTGEDEAAAECYTRERRACWMSDPAPKTKPPDDSDVDELPGDTAQPGADSLSLEEQIATLTDLEIEGEEGKPS